MDVRLACSFRVHCCVLRVFFPTRKSTKVSGREVIVDRVHITDNALLCPGLNVPSTTETLFISDSISELENT